MPVTIRLATRADREFLSTLASRLGDFPTPSWRSAQEIAEGDRRAVLSALDQPSKDNPLFIAELNGRRAGCLLLWTLEDYFTGGRHAHVSVIAVTKEAEGRGVGAALMAHAEAWARAGGFDRLTLSVFENNRRAQRLYERCGYQIELRRYVKPLSR